MRQFTADRLLLDGAAPTARQLQALALNGYGHFTAMQVRGGRVRGLELHLARLGQATAGLLGTSLDVALVCAYIRQALSPTADASVRVYVQPPDQAQPPLGLAVVPPPGG